MRGPRAAARRDVRGGAASRAAHPDALVRDRLLNDERQQVRHPGGHLLLREVAEAVDAVPLRGGVRLARDDERGAAADLCRRAKRRGPGVRLPGIRRAIRRPSSGNLRQRLPGGRQTVQPEGRSVLNQPRRRPQAASVPQGLLEAYRRAGTGRTLCNWPRDHLRKGQVCLVSRPLAYTLGG